MGETSIQPIGTVQLEPAASFDPVAGERKATLLEAPELSGEKTVEKAVSSPVMTPNVQLKFQVDNQTHEVTVLVLDRASRQVVRTIPAEEIRKFRNGDLLELFA
jgi:hypothetical protein